MDTKTQNIVIAILGLILVACLWFTFSLFGKKESQEIAVQYEESPRNVDLDFDNIDVDIDALREKYGENIDSAYAAAFPEDEAVDYSKLLEKETNYSSPRPVSDGNFDNNIPKYMVIAGAFSTDENANIFLNMLKDKGYENAEVVKFNNSRYTSICVERSDDLSIAKSEVESLKALNIEAYVHTRKLKK